MADYIRTTRKGITSLWEKMEEMNGNEMDKIHALFKSQDERLEAKQRIMELGDLSISDSMGTNLEINAPGVNKGMGLIQLGRLLGIEREEIMACGDGNNDLMRFEVEGMYEIAKRLSDYLGREVTVDFYESDFTGCMSALQANQVYFVTRLSHTDERKKTWLFTDVYHKSDECYVAKKDNENSDMFTGTLKGVKVAGQMGSIDITMTKYLYADAEIQELDNTPNMLLAVKNGKADLACMNAVSAAMSVAANDDLVVVDFFATWCGPCKMLAPTVEKMAELHPEVHFYKFYIDEDMDLATRFKVMSVPTLLYFRRGVIANKTIGVISASEMEQAIAEAK